MCPSPSDTESDVLLSSTTCRPCVSLRKARATLGCPLMLSHLVGLTNCAFILQHGGMIASAVQPSVTLFLPLKPSSG